MFQIGEIIVCERANRNNVHWLIVDIIQHSIDGSDDYYRIIPLNCQNLTSIDIGNVGNGLLSLNINYANQKYVRAT